MIRPAAPLAAGLAPTISAAFIGCARRPTTPQ